MTMQPALFGSDVVPPPPAESRDDMCTCAHSRDHHADGCGACTYGMGTRFYDFEAMKYVSGQCPCRKFRTTKRAPKMQAVNIAKPAMAVEWRRCPPELKTRRKVGGWYVKGDSTLLVFIQNTKLVSENSVRKKASAHPNPAMAQRLIAGDANQRKAHQYRTIAAIESAGCETRGIPKYARVTRIGSPRIKDDDNAIGAFKHIRDAIAEALDFDDIVFCTNGVQMPGTVGTVPIFFEQKTSGAWKAYAVLIELAW